MYPSTCNFISLIHLCRRYNVSNFYYCCADKKNCRYSAWNQHRDQTAMGGTLHVGPRTIQQCLDYCNATKACVAVDIDVNLVPLRCWVHVDTANLQPDNIYSQKDTNHYQLVDRCPNARGGWIFLSLYSI